jgi:CHAT domain-containing protein
MSRDAALVADQLLAEFDRLRPELTFAVIVELRQRVETHKFHDPVRALAIADTAVMAAAALHEPAAEALAAWAKATALLFNGRAGEALPWYRRAEQRYGELAQPLEQVGVQAPLVYALNAAGDQAAALQLAAVVQARCLALGTPARQALAHLEMNVGTIRKQQGAFAASLAACDRAKALFVALDDREGAARAELNRANVLQEMDRFAEAATAYAAARARLLASQRNRQQVALIDFNLGLLAERRGHFLAALGHLEEAHAGFAPAVHQAAADLNRALIYNRLNLPAAALQLAHAARTIFADSAMGMEEGHTLLVAGIAERQLHHAAHSIQLLQQAIALFANQQADFWQATAQLALAETYLQGAAGVQEAAERHQQSQSLATAVQAQADDATWPTLAVEARLLRVRIALLTAQPAPDQPLPLLCESIELAEHYHLTLQTLESYTLLGRYHQRENDQHAAWMAYQRAILLLTEIRRTLQIDELQLGYLADKVALYAAAARLHYESQGTEQTHALLLYLLDQAAVAPLPNAAFDDGVADDPPTAALLAELQQYQEARQWQQHKLGEPTTALGATKAALDQLETQIADCWRRIRVRRQPQPPVADGAAVHEEAQPDLAQMATTFVAALQRQLGEADALLLYATIDTELIAVVVRPERLKVVPLGPHSAVEKILHAWRFHINDHALLQQNPGLAQPLAQRILAAFDRALITPLTAALAGCTQLYLTMPPALHDLPFAAFWAEGYLLDRYQLTYLSAPAALLPQQPPRASADQPHALVIGHSHGGQLPHAVAEAQQVSATLAALGDGALCCEAAATAAAFLRHAPTATLIHIAAHAHFAPTGPLFSAIQLVDRELTLLELYHGARLCAQPLVVLSTCVSGQGTARGGGLLGLARALVAAGAGQLIVTTWRVDDAATATLMTDFYHTLVQSADCTAVGRALRRVQRTAAATLHPFYWAAFIAVKG